MSQESGRGQLALVGAAAMTLLLALPLSSSTQELTPGVVRPISDLSRQLQAEGERHALLGEIDAAVDQFEAALVADPRNADAHIGLARIAGRQRLFGKAVGHFRVALTLRPDDRQALAGQGSALLERGAVTLAQANLDALDRICAATPCAERDLLARALGKAPRRSTVLSRDAVTPKPVIAPR